MIGSKAIISQDLITIGENGENAATILPPSGKVSLLKPCPIEEDDPFYSIDTELLRSLDKHYQEKHLTNFEYVAHGQHAIIFTATNPEAKDQEPSRIVLRIHLGPLIKREAPDVFKAKKMHSIALPDAKHDNDIIVPDAILPPPVENYRRPVKAPVKRLNCVVPMTTGKLLNTTLETTQALSSADGNTSSELSFVA